MTPRRLDLAAALGVLGGALLAVALFLDFYGSQGVALSAWDAFELVDLLLLALALAGAAAALGLVPFPPALRVGIPALALVLVVYVLLDPPPAAAGADREVGAWLALAGAVLLAAGAAARTFGFHVTVDVRARPQASRPGPAAASDEPAVAADDAPTRTMRPAADPAIAPPTRHRDEPDGPGGSTRA